MKHASVPAPCSLEPMWVVLRAIVVLVERRPGMFYFRSSAFLHFHEDIAGLFADVKLDRRMFTRLAVNNKIEQDHLVRQVLDVLGEDRSVPAKPRP